MQHECAWEKVKIYLQGVQHFSLIINLQLLLLKYFFSHLLFIFGSFCFCFYFGWLFGDSGDAGWVSWRIGNF